MVNCVNEDAQAFALKWSDDSRRKWDMGNNWFYGRHMVMDMLQTKLPAFTVNGDEVQMGSFAGYKFVGRMHIPRIQG